MWGLKLKNRLFLLIFQKKFRAAVDRGYGIRGPPVLPLSGLSTSLKAIKTYRNIKTKNIVTIGLISIINYSTAIIIAISK